MGAGGNPGAKDRHAGGSDRPTACGAASGATAGGPDSLRTNYLVCAAHHLCSTNHLSNYVHSWRLPWLLWSLVWSHVLLSAAPTMYAAPKAEDSRRHVDEVNPEPILLKHQVI